MNRRDPERARLAALFDERQRWHDYAAAMFRAGYRLAQREPGFTLTELAGAYLAGQAAAAGPGFDAGYSAAMERFAEQIGGRLHTPRPTPAELRTWTRHHPRCVIGANGRRPCKRYGCIPGPRADYGKPAPWERPPDRVAVRATWGLPPTADGQVFIGGAPVHHHRCRPACYGTEPGYFAPDVARKIRRGQRT